MHAPTSDPIARGPASAAPAVPAMVEDLDLGVPVCKGLLCEDTDDLLVAYRHLGLTEATLRPVINSHRAGEGLAVVSSPDELRQYDFPYGPVVLAETVAFDRSPHGTDVSVAYLFEGAQPVGSVQQVSVGPAFFGCRSLEVPAAFEQQAQGEMAVAGCVAGPSVRWPWRDSVAGAVAAEVSSKLVGALKPKGVTSVVFGMVDSKPVLVSVHTDAAGMEYFATLFMERHFPRRKVPFFTWFVQPRSCRVDIWTAWARMVEAGIAMNPRTDRKGVFPLVLLKDTMAVLIAVGDSGECAGAQGTEARVVWEGMAERGGAKGQ